MTIEYPHKMSAPCPLRMHFCSNPCEPVLTTPLRNVQRYFLIPSWRAPGWGFQSPHYRTNRPPSTPRAETNISSYFNYALVFRQTYPEVYIWLLFVTCAAIGAGFVSACLGRFVGYTKRFKPLQNGILVFDINRPWASLRIPVYYV